jgi:hypothetical protein
MFTMPFWKTEKKLCLADFASFHAINTPTRTIYSFLSTKWGEDAHN